MHRRLMSKLSDDLCNDAKGAFLNVYLDESEDAEARALQGSRTKPFERCDDDHQREEVERAMFLSSLMG